MWTGYVHMLVQAPMEPKKQIGCLEAGITEVLKHRIVYFLEVKEKKKR